MGRVTRKRKLALRGKTGLESVASSWRPKGNLRKCGALPAAQRAKLEVERTAELGWFRGFSDKR